MIPRRKKVRTGPDKSGLPFAPPHRPDQRERKRERNRTMGSDRRAVLARSLGRCEFLCAVAGEPTEAHHVLGGADRRALESEFSEAAVCEDCHARCNASPAWARVRGLAWAQRMAARELQASALALEAERTLEAEAHTGRARQFLATAERLEARIALAAAQAVNPTDRRSA